MRQEKLTKRITIRLTESEGKRLQEYSDMGQISLSNYVRKTLLGGRPIVAHTDTKMIGELRRIGGLLKHNFETIRDANASSQCFDLQKEALKKLINIINRIGVNNYE